MGMEYCDGDCFRKADRCCVRCGGHFCEGCYTQHNRTSNGGIVLVGIMYRAEHVDKPKRMN